MLNESKGNMYEFVTHTWNVIKGKCPHDCEYCYMKIFKLGQIRFDGNELKTDLGKLNFIFVGSSCDMWADAISGSWIEEILAHTRKYDNTYLFQSKNPKRFLRFGGLYPKKRVFGITLETNRVYPQMGKTPTPEERVNELSRLGDNRKMITIEPIMDFDVDILLAMVESAEPEWVNIGADSKGHNLPEPSKRKILELIDGLQKFTEIEQKRNIERLLKVSS